MTQNHSTGQVSNEVSNLLGGETITRCYQCGTCASSCPVTKLSSKFNPREIIKLSLLGQTEKILANEALWLCCSCYNCQERCPQKVEIADVIYALRNLAIKKGYIPAIYSEFFSAISTKGRIATVSKFVEKKRIDLGLPALTATGINQLKEILSATGFNKLVLKEETE